MSTNGRVAERRWLLCLGVLTAAGAAAAVPRTVMAATNFNVTAAGQSSYTIDGTSDPTLTLTRGETYTFTVSVSAHPFWITTALGADDAEANQWSMGVTNNGASPGTVTFVVPQSAPATLFYQCGFHEPMQGQLNIVSAAAAQDIPWGGPVAQAALVAVVLLLGMTRLRSTGVALETPEGV